MANNKVVLADGTVLMDTSGVTVDESHLIFGYTALDHTGSLIVGTYVVPSDGDNIAYGGNYSSSVVGVGRVDSMAI